MDKNKIAIVTVGYNRIASMKRLLYSLSKAKYPIDNIPLYISIDASGDTELYNFVRSYDWLHGEKIVNIQNERLGLKNHILQCGDLTKRYKAIILLEDDIYVSEYFYDYVYAAVNFYYEDDRIGGISLYRNEMRGSIPKYTILDGKDTFLFQSVASWGECWTDRQWAKFRKWYEQFDEDFSKYDMQLTVKQWTRAWSKYYMAYQLDTNRYFVFPQISLTTCFGDAGEHGGKNTIGQVNLLAGKKEYHFPSFEEMTKYDIYANNIKLYEWIGLSEDELCLDLNGNNPNYKNKRYILSTYHYPYKVIKSFELSLFPIELNVKDNIEGEGIYLYDTQHTCTNKQKNPSLIIANYYLKGFNIRLLRRYVIHQFFTRLKAKLHL